MALTGKYTGRDLVIRFIHAGGTTVVSGEYRSLSVSESGESADTTAGSAPYKTHVPTLIEVSGDFSYLDEGTANSIGSALAVHTQGTLEWGPRGTANGAPRYGIPVTIMGVESPVEYAGELVRTVNWVGNGNWTANYDRSGSTWS